MTRDEVIMYLRDGGDVRKARRAPGRRPEKGIPRLHSAEAVVLLMEGGAENGHA